MVGLVEAELWVCMEEEEEEDTLEAEGVGVEEEEGATSETMASKLRKRLAMRGKAWSASKRFPLRTHEATTQPFWRKPQLPHQQLPH